MTHLTQDEAELVARLLAAAAALHAMPLYPADAFASIRAAALAISRIAEEREALKTERTSLIDTKRLQIDALTARATAAEAALSQMKEALGDTRTFLTREFGTIDPEINGVVGWIDEAIGPVEVLAQQPDKEGI